MPCLTLAAACHPARPGHARPSHAYGRPNQATPGVNFSPSFPMPTAVPLILPPVGGIWEWCFPEFSARWSRRVRVMLPSCQGWGGVSGKRSSRPHRGGWYLKVNFLVLLASPATTQLRPSYDSATETSYQISAATPYYIIPGRKHTCHSGCYAICGFKNFGGSATKQLQNS